MKIEIIVEKSPDNLFAAYATTSIDGFNLAGYGETVEEALSDLDECLEEMNEIRHEGGLETVQVEFEFKYDIESFFDRFNYLNISKVAEKADINPSLMRQYASGLSKAGPKQYAKIKGAVKSIVRELSLINF